MTRVVRVQGSSTVQPPLLQLAQPVRWEGSAVDEAVFPLPAVVRSHQTLRSERVV